MRRIFKIGLIAAPIVTLALGLGVAHKLTKNHYVPKIRVLESELGFCLRDKVPSIPEPKENLVVVGKPYYIETAVSIDSKAMPEESNIIIYVPNFGGNSWKFYTNISHFLPYKQKSHNPKNIKEIMQFITPQHPTVQEVVKTITQNQDNEEKKAQLIMDFVNQHLNDRYLCNNNYLKYPIETLVEGGGDRKDLSILAASLLKGAGFDVGLIEIAQLSADSVKTYDMMVGLTGNFDGWYRERGEKKYYMAEVRGTQWKNTKFNPPQISFISKKYHKKETKLHVIY